MIFFWPEGKKIEKFDIFRGNFSKPKLKLAEPTRPEPSNKKLTRTNPGSTLFDPDPSVLEPDINALTIRQQPTKETIIFNIRTNVNL